MSRANATPHPRQWLPVAPDLHLYLKRSVTKRGIHTRSPIHLHPSQLYRNVLLPTPTPPPSVRANKVKVCTLATKCSCVQRSLSTLAVHVALSAAVNDASCVRWEERGMSRVP
ncbi:hypothetical protein Q7P35_003190 [Cladosporium inversicolor]